jgi:arsenate reductase (thioredoxin)
LCANTARQRAFWLPSVLAAAYFNRFAEQLGLNTRAVARGTNPDEELSVSTVKGLAEDGLTPTELVPRKLTAADLQSAQRIVSFCDLPADIQQQTVVDRWVDVPSVSENYEKARDVIIEHIHQMLDQ